VKGIGRLVSFVVALMRFITVTSVIRPLCRLGHGTGSVLVTRVTPLQWFPLAVAFAVLGLPITIAMGGLG